jgi:murein DD-endopeptidase MepM/ murein hydrolase activator NlpD
VLALLVAQLLLLLFPPPGRAPAASMAPVTSVTSVTSVASVAADPVAWSWPLAGTPPVLRGFELPSEPWLAGHRGVDLLASPGAPVRAAGAGTVTFAGWVGGLPIVSVTHVDGRRTTYQPVLAAVARGAPVGRGAILGRISAGGSHCLPQACLHWGLRTAGGTYLDPLSLLGVNRQVRLLPVWSGPGWSAAASVPDSGPPSSLAARLGALNRARASPWGLFGSVQRARPG